MYRTTVSFDLLAARKASICASAQGISASEYVRRAVDAQVARDLPLTLSILDASDEPGFDLLAVPDD